MTAPKTPRRREGTDLDAQRSRISAALEPLPRVSQVPARQERLRRAQQHRAVTPTRLAVRLQTIATASLCYAAYSLVGYVSTAGSRHERTAGLISMTYINNVLVAVFAFQFFGPPVAALAALYNIPYYAGIVAIKKVMPKY